MTSFPGPGRSFDGGDRVVADPAAPPPVLWHPSEERIAAARITAFADFVAGRTGRRLPDYDALWRYSVEDVGGFWAQIADFFALAWHQRPADPRDALTVDAMPGARWFGGGTLNYAEHALRALPGRGDGDVAVLETDESGNERAVTLAELRALVGAAQAGLARLGVGRGDRVAAFLPNRLEAVVAFLAAAALGAVWSSCAPEFGASSVTDRFAQIEPVVLLAVDGYRYGGKDFDLSGTVAEIRSALPSLAAVVHVDGIGGALPDTVSWADLVATPAETSYVPVGFDDPLWVLYSSGTTGLPKPIVQSAGGIVVEHLKTLALHHDLGPGKRFFWFSTTGWMMWNLLVGGLLVGATVVTYDGNPAAGDLMALYRLAARHRIDYFGISAAFVTACRAAHLAPSNEADLSCVRTVGSTGSPLSTDGFDWIMAQIGPDVQIASLSGGTDVCTAIVGAAPTVPVWRGEISARILGCAVAAFDGDGRAVVGEVGELVLTRPMPSMPVAFFGDADGSRLRAAYFEDYPGVWRHGDWIRITDRGSCVIEGRSDATLNRGGVRMGTAEFYRVVEGVDGIADALVVDTSAGGREGDLILFVVLTDRDVPGVVGAGVGAVGESMTSSLRAAIRSGLSPRHVPNRIVAVPAVPRTLSGKKCEVPVKRILSGTAIADTISRDALSDADGFDAFLAVLADTGLLPGAP